MLPTLAQLLGNQPGSPLMGNMSQPGQMDPFNPPAAMAQPAAAPGAANTPRYTGLSGFVDRFLNPTNPIGKLGKYLAESSPGSVFGGMWSAADQDLKTQQDQQYQRQKYAMDLAKANQPEYRTVGNDLLAISPNGGAPTVAYAGKDAPTNTQRTYEYLAEQDKANGTNYASSYLANAAEGPLVAVDSYGPNGQQMRSYMRPSALTGAAPSGVPGSLAPPLAPEPTKAAGGTYSGPDPMGFAGVTSGRRTPYGNKLVGGVGNSDHLNGNAADYAYLPGESQADAIKRAQDYFGPTARILPEKDHLHITFPGYGKVPLYGKNGTKTAGGVAKPATRSIGGKTFYQVNGDWYDNPEGK